MIDRTVFYTRLSICKACENWKGACLKGHVLQGTLGCPLRKFEGEAGAPYMEDLPVPLPEQPKTSSGGCCGAAAASSDIKPMTWPEVWRHLVSAMSDWKKSGYSLVDSDTYVKRVNTCRTCPKEQYRWFQCKHCRCVVYVKAKLSTETCPYGFWEF